MIGIAMSTHNRPEVRAQAIAEWKRHTQPDTLFLLVDDASDAPAEGADYRFESNVGIAATKNKCIELLMNAGVEHLFLTDDDAWPVVDRWWEPYVTSSFGHLMYLKGLEHKAKPVDDRHWYSPRGRGGVLYYHRSVIDRVGGMRTEFPRWGDEHIEHSQRIHNAGLIPHAFMDVNGSRELWCYDRTQESSVPLDERTAYGPIKKAVMERFKGTSDFVSYRRFGD